MLRPVEGYPDSWGAKKVSLFPVAGPASYSQYTAPSTGGQDVNVQGPSGLKMADAGYGGITTDGLYRVDVVRIEPATVNGVLLVGALLVLKWTVLSTGSQVAGAVNLAGSTVNILVLGQK